MNVRQSIPATLSIPGRDERGETPGDHAFRALAEHTSDIIVRIDRALHCVYVNRAITTVTGVAPEAFIGMTPAELGLLSDDAEAWQAAARQVFETAQPVELYTKCMTPHGARSYHTRLLPELGDDGTVRYALGVVRDVTSHERTELASHVLDDAACIFAAASLDVSQTLAAVAQVLAETLGDACIVWLLSEDGRTRHIAAMHHPDPAAQALLGELARDVPSQPAETWSLLSGQTDWYPSLSPEQAAERVWPPFRPYLDHFPTHSLIAAPLRARRGVIGAIRLSRDVTPHPYSRADLELIERLTDQAALAIDNARLYREAQVAEARYRSLFSGVGDAILVANARWDYIDCNAAFSTLTGYTAADLALVDPADLIPDHDLAADVSAIMAREGYWRGELDIRRKDGTSVPVEVTITAIDLLGGRYFLAVLRDIAERRALEQLQQEFTAMVTHELKAPLTSLKGFAELMRRRQAYDERAVTFILAQTEQLNRLISDLLDAARVQAKQLDLRRTHVDLSDLIHVSVEQARAGAPGQEFVARTPEMPITGWWDAGRIAQVVENLLSNAVKYSPGGGTVRVVVERKGDEAVVTVADEGIGIPPDAVPHLFERFYRVERAEGSARGLGLGLYIARSLVEAHDGRIWVEATPQRGSTFAFTLPFRRAEGHGPRAE
jgi:PAS domain S-box-containing protein